MKPGRHRDEEPEAVVRTPLGVQILAFITGLVIAFLGFKSMRQDYRIIEKLFDLDRLAETPGKLLKVGIRNDSAGSSDEFYPDMLYEYFVDGKNIWGWRLSYEDEPKTKAFWQKRISAYASGSRVPVYYDPADPKESILEKKQDGLYRAMLKMALGGGFLLFGLLLAVLPATGWIRKGAGLRK